MKKIMIILTTIICLIFKSASARDISVFAVNFGEAEIENILLEKLEESLKKEEAIVGVIDATRPSVVGYFSYDHSLYGDKSAYRGILSDIGNRFNNDQKDINLPLVLSYATEFIFSNYTEGDNVEIFLVDVLEHKGRDYSFEDGFPNDGFLSLNDNDFSLIKIIPGSFSSRVFAVQLTKNEFKDEYQKFAYHLSNSVLGGELLSFSFTDNASSLSFDEPLQEKVANLNSVTASRVINAEERPVCEVEDVVQIVQKAERLEIVVKNVSRSNSIGNFLLTVGASSEEGQFSFDSAGTGFFSVKRLPGEGVLSVSDCSGGMQEHFSYDVDELDDVISVIGVSEDIAKISGENIQRIDGSDVIIVDENTGRRWVTQVENGRYSIEVPIAPGKHVFYVERPFSGRKQYFEVLLQEKCTFNSNLSYNGAVGLLKVQTTCATQDVLSLSYGDETYSARFSSDQSAKIEFPLTCGSTYGLWKVGQRPENEFVVQYTINPDRISVEEKPFKVSITIKNLSRANSEARYSAIIGGETLDGSIIFDNDGVTTIDLPRTTPGLAVFNLEDCQGDLTQAGSYNVSEIDDDIDVTVLSNEEARIVGENIQRPDGSQVKIKNETTGEEWTVAVQNGRYSLETFVPPGVQKFSIIKPFSEEKYKFDVKVRDECRVSNEIEFDSGIAVLTVISDCDIEEEIFVRYNDREYRATFDSQGKVQFKLPMECGEVTGMWSVDAFGETFETALDCTGKLRVILRWNDPVDLDLHILEGASGGLNSGVGWAYFAKCLGPNNPECKAAGFINKDCTSSEDSCGLPKEEYYQVEIADLPSSARSITAMVNNYTRDNSGTPSGQHCGDGEYAQVSFTITAYIENERYERRGISEHRKRFRRVPCNTARNRAAFINENELTIPFR